jgi:hypothetical protein
MKSPARVIALSIVSVLALAGCLKVDMNVTLNEDDTASGEYVMAVSKDLAELMGDEDLSTALGSDPIEGATTEPYEDDEFVGTTTTFEEVPLEDLSDGTMSVTREDDEFVVAGSPGELGGEMATEEIPAGATATLSVTFPGAVSDHNGVLDGNTVTWDLLDAPAELEARGSATSDGAGIPLWILIVVFAVMGIGIGVAVVLITATKRKGPANEESALAEAEAGILTHDTFTPEDTADAPLASEETAPQDGAASSEDIAPTEDLPTNDDSAVTDHEVEPTGGDEEAPRQP